MYSPSAWGHSPVISAASIANGTSTRESNSALLAWDYVKRYVHKTHSHQTAGWMEKRSRWVVVGGFGQGALETAVLQNVS